jgi:hypothetical protein
MTLHRRAALGALALGAAAPPNLRPAQAQQSDRTAEDIAILSGGGTERGALPELARGQRLTNEVGVLSRLEVVEQDALADPLTAGGAPRPTLTPEASAEIEAMAVLTGSGFDREYLSAQRAGHIETLNVAKRLAAHGDTSVPVVIGTTAMAGMASHLTTIDMVLDAV